MYRNQKFINGSAYCLLSKLMKLYKKIETNISYSHLSCHASAESWKNFCSICYSKWYISLDSIS